MGNSNNFRHLPTVDTTNVGYSDLRLWPCYLALTSLLLIFAPIIGLPLSFLAIGIPAFLIARFAAKREKKDVTAYYAQWEAIQDLFDSIELRDRALEEYNAMPMVDLRSVNTPPKETLERTSPIPKERSLAAHA